MGYAATILGPQYAPAAYPATPSTPLADVRIAKDKVKNLIWNEYALYGVRGVGIAMDTDVQNRPVVVVNAADPARLRGVLPASMDGVPIVIRQVGEIHAQEFAPAGEPASAPEIYRRRSDGAMFRVGWRGRCMDGPTQLIPVDGGTAIEWRGRLADAFDPVTVPAGRPGPTFGPNPWWEYTPGYASAGDPVSDFLNPILNSQGVSAISDHAVDRLAENLSRDVALQRTVGIAAGKAVATELRPFIIAGVATLAVGAAGIIYLVASGNEIEKRD